MAKTLSLRRGEGRGEGLCLGFALALPFAAGFLGPSTGFRRWVCLLGVGLWVKPLSPKP